MKEGGYYFWDVLTTAFIGRPDQYRTREVETVLIRDGVSQGRTKIQPGGRMIIPVGHGEQDLLLIEKNESGITRRSTIPVRFVPMTGKALQGPPRNKE